MKLEVKTKAKDGTYGPFHFMCDLVVKDGIVMAEPLMPEGGHYELAEDGSSLTFVHDPAPAPEAEEPKPEA